MKPLDDLTGGGGGKSGGDGRPREAVNNLLSNHIVRVVEAICEGPIAGIEQVYLQDTPVFNEDGTTYSDNFRGLSVYKRLGLPDQAHVAGIPSQEAEVGVDAQVTKDTPITRTVTEPLTDAIRVTVRIPALYKFDDDGDMVGTNLKYAIERRANGGAWAHAPGSPFTLRDRKATSPAFLKHRVPVSGNGPWDIRVTRITDDSDADSRIQNELYLHSLTQILDQKLTYPNTAYVVMEASAEQFGNQLPARGFLIKGLICDVPVNFDPEARTYSGTWNGTFKRAWTDCPAWCMREMVQASRWGLGEFVPGEMLDDATLYTISRYCAERVDNGRGGQEPRFTLNAYINTRQDAYDLLNAMASVFRGMVYWSLGLVTFAQDRPTEPVLTVTRANTVNGDFTYSQSSIKAVHNRISVTYNNPDDMYRRDVVTVDDPDHIRKYGLRPADLVAFACTNKAQAIRAGRWLLYTERMESDTLTYVGGADHVDIAPGMVVRVMDPRMQGQHLGGRVRAYEGNSITLDRKVTIETGKDYELVIHDRDRKIHYRTVTSAPGARTKLTLASDLPELDPTPEHTVWALTELSANDALYRVLGSREIGVHQYEITAVRNEPTKYDIIENGYEIPGYPLPLMPTGALPIPSNLRAEVRMVPVEGAEPRHMLTISVSRSSDPRVRGVEVRYKVKGQPWSLVDLRQNLSHDVALTANTRAFQVQARSYDGAGNYSLWTRTLRGGKSDILEPVRAVPPVTNTVISGGVRNIVVKWENPDIPDYRGTEIYTAETNDAGTRQKVDAINGTRIALGPFAAGTVRHVWLRAVAHGKPARFSDFVYVGSASPTGVEATDLPIDGNYTPPNGFVLTTELRGADAWIIATWDAVAVGAQYSAEITEEGGNFVSFPTTLNRYEWRVRAGRTYSVRVRTMDGLGRLSNYTDTLTIVAAKDDVPPATPTGFTAVGSFGAAFLKWNTNTEEDLSHYEVYESATTTAPGAGATATHSVTANILTISGIPANTTKHYWLRAVDTSDNRSPWTARGEATTLGTTAITTADLQGMIDATSFAAGVRPFEIVTALPAAPHTKGRVVFLTTENELYRNTGTGWTKAVDGSNLLQNSVGVGVLQAGAVSADQIAANAFTAKTVSIADFTNLVPNGDLQNGDISALEPSGEGSPWVLYTRGAQNLTASTTSPLPFYLYAEPDGLAYVRRSYKNFAVNGDQEELLVDFRYAGSGTTINQTVDILLRFRDAAGTIITTRTVPVTVTSTGWNRATVNVTPPAAAATCYSVDVRRVAGGTGGAAVTGIRVMRRNAGSLLVDGSVKAAAVDVNDLAVYGLANLNVAYIKEANVSGTLSASILRTGTTLTGGILVSGTALSTVASRADNPAARVNAQSTLIAPGKIQLNGTTSLSHWITGGDNTSINGGAIEANTVKSNAITIGSRGIHVDGIQFEPGETDNTLSWSAGRINYIGDDGVPTSQLISAGSTTWITNTRYIYWQKGSATLTATTISNDAGAENRIVLATYNGGDQLTTDYGKTVITGALIKTGTVKAYHLIKTQNIITEQAQLGTATVRTLTVEGEAISANRIYASNFSSPGDYSNGTTWRQVKQWAVTLPHSTNYIITVDGKIAGGFDGNETAGIRLRINGNIIYERETSLHQAIPDLAKFSAWGTVAAGSHVLSVDGYESGLGLSPSGLRGYQNLNVFIFGAAR